MTVSTTSTTFVTPADSDAAGGHLSGILKLRGQHHTADFAEFPELEEKGWTIVRGVLSPEKSAEYVQRVYQWAEGFGKGFKHDDRSTWHIENMPAFTKGGMFNRNCVGHEQFMWDLRTEPGILKVHEKLWGTDQLLSAIDGVNLSLPYPDGELGTKSAPWPHVDQSPNRTYKHSIQAIVNLLPNGPKDGGLMVLDGSFKLFEQFFKEHEHEAPPNGWYWTDSFPFTKKNIEWFLDHGCKWKKLECEPGDLMVWDSRCVHYGASATGDQPRVAGYLGYKPAKDVSAECLAIRHRLMREYGQTSHDPLLFREKGTHALGKLTDDERTEPSKPPVLTDQMKQLAGTMPYPGLEYPTWTQDMEYANLQPDDNMLDSKIDTTAEDRPDKRD